MRPVDGERDPLAMLSDAAAKLAPPPPDPGELDRMVRVAVVASGRRQAKRTEQRRVLAMAAMVLFGVGAGAIASLAWPRDPSAPQIANRIELPTGDRITRLGEGEVGIEHATSMLRQLSVSGGHTLFDVAPLEPGERFEVTTPHLCASVVGTVFALDVTSERTRVSVFDGVVQVVAPGMDPVRLERGETFDSETRGAIEGWRSPLHREGWVAARAHRARRRVQREEAIDHEAAPAAPVADAPTPAPAPEVERIPSLAQARRWLAAGENERARRAATAACERWPANAEWRLLLADALRAERSSAEAVAEYERAAHLLPPSRATSAAYLAADLRLNALHDPRGALRVLDELGAARPGSPIEERASALSIRARIAAGETQIAQDEARRYLARFPAGPSRSWIAELIDAPAQ